MVGDVGGTISDLLMMTTTASWKVRLQIQPLLRIHSPRAKVTGKVCAFKHMFALITFRTDVCMAQCTSNRLCSLIMALHIDHMYVYSAMFVYSIPA